MKCCSWSKECVGPKKKLIRQKVNSVIQEIVILAFCEKIWLFLIKPCFFGSEVNQLDQTLLPMPSINFFEHWILPKLTT